MLDGDKVGRSTTGGSEKSKHAKGEQREVFMHPRNRYEAAFLSGRSWDEGKEMALRREVQDFYLVQMRLHQKKRSGEA